MVLIQDWKIQMNTRTKRIVKNTFMLYFRTLFMMVVGLYTSRVVINALGLSDYGIYNIVGGVVGLFGFINSSMTRSTQRFLNFELGKNDLESINNVFSNSIIIHSVIALVIFILAETFGLWFVINKLVIPPEKLTAALIVYQCTVLSTILMIVGVPYNSLIIAYEQMNIFAYFSMIDVFLKLCAAFFICFFTEDKLGVYAVLLLLIQIISFLIYFIYCKTKYTNLKISLKFNRNLFRRMFSFTSWTIIGELAYIGFTQGINIILNIFFGPIINASRAISVQIQNAVKQFAGGFQTAMNPQIVKTYSNGDKEYLNKLIFEGSRISFFLVFIFSVPFFLETNLILKFWIKVVPEYCCEFVRLILIISIIDTMITPLIIAASATGKIRNYQITLGGLLLMIVPVSYIFLRLGFKPTSVLYVHLCITIVSLFVRLYYAKQLNDLNIKEYICNVIVKSIFSVGPVFLIIWFSHHFLFEQINSFSRLMITILYMIILTLIFIRWGLNDFERNYVLSKLQFIKNNYL